jgi:hypothetical protein
VIKAGNDMGMEVDIVGDKKGDKTIGRLCLMQW